jgi:hypothetical protein
MKAFEAGMTDSVPKPWANSDIDHALQHISSTGSTAPTLALQFFSRCCVENLLESADLP